jgi:tight adherence protein B
VFNFVISVAIVLLIYLALDYLFSFKNDRILDRLNAGFVTKEENLPSLWAGAADLLQLESLRRLLYESTLTRTFDIRIKRADLNIDLLQAIAVLNISAIATAIISYFYFKSFYAFIGGLFVMPIVMWLMLSMLSTRQQKIHDHQLAALITSLLTTMRAGGTPLQALQATAKSSANPMGKSITTVMNKLQIGRPPAAVWQEWADFWGTKNTRLLAAGFRLKWETGGQMSDILEHILETIEFTKRIELRIGTLTAQAKLSAYVLSIMPVALGLLQYNYRPDLITAMMNDEMGKGMLIYAGISTFLGFIWLQKMAKLK